MLKVKNLKISFGKNFRLRNISFEVRRGEIVSLIGPNGAGKSTILNIISGILKAEKGNLFIGELNLKNQEIHEISKKGISRSFQVSRNFKNLTVRENLLLSLIDGDNLTEVFSPIKIELSRDFIKIFELESILDKEVSKLSYGERRLVEIARTILKPHKVLLFDELTSGINPVLRERFKKIILDLKNKGEAILLVEHDVDFVFDISDRIIFLDEGKILKIGKPYQIKKDKRLISIYFGIE